MTKFLELAKLRPLRIGCMGRWVRLLTCLAWRLPNRDPVANGCFVDFLPLLKRGNTQLTRDILVADVDIRPHQRLLVIGWGALLAIVWTSLVVASRVIVWMHLVLARLIIVWTALVIARRVTVSMTPVIARLIIARTSLVIASRVIVWMLLVLARLIIAWTPLVIARRVILLPLHVVLGRHLRQLKESVSA